MLWAATITTEFFVCIEDGCQLNVLDITASQMEATHAAVVVTLAFVIFTVSAFMIVAHFAFLVGVRK